jgi:hypothetical protein
MVLLLSDSNPFRFVDGIARFVLQKAELPGCAAFSFSDTSPFGADRSCAHNGPQARKAKRPPGPAPERSEGNRREDETAEAVS